MTGASDGGRVTAPGTWMRVLGIAIGAALMFLLVMWLGAVSRRPALPEHPAVTPMALPYPPIAAEAGVFATDLSALAVPTDAERRATAHPRTLAMYRSVRAYPGAPPAFHTVSPQRNSRAAPAADATSAVGTRRAFDSTRP